MMPKVLKKIVDNWSGVSKAIIRLLRGSLRWFLSAFKDLLTFLSLFLLFIIELIYAEISQNLIRFVAILLALLGVWIAVTGAEDKTLSEFINDFYANISTELLSIALTVLVINELLTRSESRSKEREDKARLTRRLRSDEREVSMPALEELRVKEWGFYNDKSLVNLIFRHSDLSKAELQHINLSSSMFYRVNMSGVLFYNCDFKSTVFSGGTLEGSTFVSANFSHSSMNDVSIMNSEFEGNWNNFTRASLVEVQFQGAANIGSSGIDPFSWFERLICNAYRLCGSILPDGSRYDGRLNLEGDLLDIEESIERALCIDRGVSTWKRNPEIFDEKENIVAAYFEGSIRNKFAKKYETIASAHYGIPVEVFQNGQNWSRENLERIRGMKQSGIN